jgi:hypothetical protein
MAHLPIPLELTKISGVTRKGRGIFGFSQHQLKKKNIWPVLFVVSYQIGRYFTFEGGNVQFILSLRNATSNTCGFIGHP